MVQTEDGPALVEHLCTTISWMDAYDKMGCEKTPDFPPTPDHRHDLFRSFASGVDTQAFPVILTNKKTADVLGVTTYTCDANGNLLSDGSATFEYDAANSKDICGNPCPDPPAWWLGEQ